jgi:hypothetical protein
MVSRTQRRWSFLFAILLLLAPLPAAAQFNAAIQGTVTDSSGGVLPGANVHITNVTTGVKREVVTSTEGVYRAPSLAPGTYRVEVDMDGFAKSAREVNVGISETARVDITLRVSGVAEVVTVAATAPLIETEQGRVSGRVDRQQMQEMPLSGRNLYNLIALQPGVVGRGLSSSISGGGGADDSFAGESAPRINASGQRDEANSFTVDDTSVNGVARGGITNLTPNTESVEEVRVVANNFSAVDGRNPGAQVQVITKGGSNTFKGSGSYYFQNDALLAKNVFETAVPKFKKHQFGYSFGGPVVKNRLFFFTSYEGLRQNGARGANYTVETEAFRDFVARTRPNTIAAKLLSKYQPAVYPTAGLRDLGSPAPGWNTIGAADGIMDVGTVNFVPEAWRRGNQFSVRMDYELRPGKDRLYGSFYRTTSYAITGGIRPQFNRATPNWTTFWNVNHTHIFNSSALNELRVGFMRLVGIPDEAPNIDVPGITITGATGFSTSSYPNGWWQDNYHVKDIFTWIKGSHQIKTGGELRLMWGSATNTTNYVPAYQFTNLLNFADDEARQMTRYVDPRTGEPVTAYSELAQTEWALFVNDDWKISRNLSINVGVRYENYGTFRDTDDGLRNLILGSGSTFNERLANAKVDFVDKFYPTDNNNFAPRVGFAWDPKGNGKTSIRGGYGLAYDRLMNLPAENYRNSPPTRASVTLGPPYGTAFSYTLGDTSKSFLGYPVDPALKVGLDSRNGVKGARVGLTVVDPNVRSPYTHNWFFGIQRELFKGIVLDVNYLGSAGRGLFNAYNLNRFVGDMIDGTFNGFNPSFGSIAMVTSTSKSDYQGVSITAKRAFRQGFMLQGSYTYGRSKNDTDAAVGTTNYQDAANIMGDWAVSGWDVPHKLSLVGMWELPFFKQSGGFLKAAFGGWQLAGYGILQAGTPINITNSAAYPSGDYNADNNSGDRPDAPASSVKTSGWTTDEFLAGIFKASDFPKPGAGQNGNLARNAYRGPGYVDFSMSLSKRFVLKTHYSLEVRLDGFNVFNRRNLNNPNTDLSSVDFGKVTSQLATRSAQLGFRLRF